MNFDRRLLSLVSTAVSSFALTVLLNISSGILIIFWALVLSRVVNGVFLEGQTLEEVKPLIWLLVGLSLVRAVLTWGGEVSAAALATRVKCHLREILVKHIQRLGPAFVQQESTGALVTTAIQGVELLDAYFSQYLPQIIIAAVLPLMILGIVFPIDWLTGLVFLLTAPLIPLFMILIGKTSEKLTHKQFEALRRMSFYFLDTLQGLTTLKLLNRAEKETDKISRVSEVYRQQTMSVLRLTFLSALVLEWLSTLSVAVVAVEIGIRLLYARMGFEQAFFILVIAPEFYLPLRTLGLRFHASATGVAAGRKIFEVLGLPIPRREAVVVKTNPALSLPEAPYTIEFKQVSFAYDQREVDAVDRVSFTLAAGSHTALVGASGAGKSTIASLLLGFLSPASGEIRVNGVSLAELPLDWWRRQLVWVPQRPYIFQTSIAANIGLGKADASEEELWRAVQLANLEEFVRSLPQGLNTVVGDKGAKLSGGQAQRIALARAFLRDAPLVVLDEPTSHLDSDLEALLTEATRRLCEQRTVLTIAHRLTTVVQAEQIIVLEAGRVLECGRHAQLAAAGGKYRQLMAAYQGEEV